MILAGGFIICQEGRLLGKVEEKVTILWGLNNGIYPC